MNVARLLSVLHQESRTRAYIRRNDRFDTTNLALIHNEQRIYARDQLGGAWHRHTIDAPHVHDTSAEGRRPVNLSEFLDEVETVLATMGLP